MSDLILTRAEIERRLEKGLLNRNVSFLTIRDVLVTGKIQRLSIEVLRDTEELMVNFKIDTKKYEVDLVYFSENLTIHYGDTYNGERQDVRRILETN